MSSPLDIRSVWSSGPPPLLAASSMQRVVHLGLYGSIEHGPEFDLCWDLYQTGPLARLRDISLSSTPSRFAPHGTAAGRFQHSVGVSYLVRKLCEHRKSLFEHRDLLMSAALCHDIGSPPFSHISELFFYDQTGRTHEQQTAMLLAPGTELDKVLGSYGVNSSEVVSIINGEHEPLGPLIAGSIDLDNVDNSLHLLTSLGYNYQPYHPLRLIRAFQVRGDKISLNSEYLSEILGWSEARRTLYRLLHSEPNLSSATMLYRALEFAYSNGDLTDRFFEMDEADAMFTLRERSTESASYLAEQLLRWRQYPLVFEQHSSDEDMRLVSLYEDWKARKRFADRIASELGVKRREVAVYVGRDRGEKSILLPFTGPQKRAAEMLFADRKGEQRLAVFCHKSVRENNPHDEYGRVPRVGEIVREAVRELPEAKSAPGHVFF